MLLASFLLTDHRGGLCFGVCPNPWINEETEVLFKTLTAHSHVLLDEQTIRHLKPEVRTIYHLVADTWSVSSIPRWCSHVGSKLILHASHTDFLRYINQKEFEKRICWVLAGQATHEALYPFYAKIMAVLTGSTFKVDERVDFGKERIVVTDRDRHGLAKELSVDFYDRIYSGKVIDYSKPTIELPFTVTTASLILQQLKEQGLDDDF